MAEHIVLQAGELGVPVTILRLPFVSGHTNTGAHANSTLYMYTHACISVQACMCAMLCLQTYSGVNVMNLAAS